MLLPQGHAADVFEAYSQLLTEMVLRLPYQIKKIADINPRIPPPIFDHCWFYFLSEVIQSNPPRLKPYMAKGMWTPGHQTHMWATFTQHPPPPFQSVAPMLKANNCQNIFAFCWVEVSVYWI